MDAFTILITTAIALFVVVFLLLSAGIPLSFFYFVMRVEDNIDKLRNARFSPEEMLKKWEILSKNGHSPAMVVALTTLINKKESNFQKKKAFASAYYSQVKFELKRLNFFLAIALFLTSLQNAKEALKEWPNVPNDRKSQIDLEVLGAPYFMASQIPLFGRFFRKKALEFLHRAYSEHGIIPAVAPDSALICAKIYRLTGDQHYKEEIKGIGLTRNMDADKLRRITEHLGMFSIDDLFEFCGPFELVDFEL